MLWISDDGTGRGHSRNINRIRGAQCDAVFPFAYDLNFKYEGRNDACQVQKERFNRTLDTPVLQPK